VDGNCEERGSADESERMKVGAILFSYITRDE